MEIYIFYLSEKIIDVKIFVFDCGMQMGYDLINELAELDLNKRGVFYEHF